MSRNEYDPIDTLATFAIDLNMQGIPREVLAFQSQRLIDNLGCLAAGYLQSGTNVALHMARRWSGCAEAHVIGSREKLAAPQAAFVNAVRARALDYCDVLSPGWHPSSSDIPVALATAELGEASGGEMLAALAIGQDVGQRINLAAQQNGFFYRGFDSNILGLFSGAVIASRLLKLDAQQCRDAIGLAFDAGIGTFQHYQDKTLAVRISQGMVARHAIEAALLAKAGISGPRRILCGENGFFNLYAPGQPALEHLTTGLGRVFAGREATCFKLYPHCSILLALTDALINNALPERFMPGPDTPPLLLKASPTMRMVCGADYVPEQTPEIDAQFSARYIIANALLRKRATPAEFNAKAARCPSVIALAQQITLQEVAEFERFDQSELIFTASDGETHTIASAWGRGWPENPLTLPDIVEKFRICCGLSPCLGFSRNVPQIIKMIEQLTTSSSVLPLMALLGGEET